jgi:two-component system chemotaxis sensor kinase CheA
MFDKKVRVEMEGRDTELDKTLIEAIKDPLTHIVRNAVDHGIEPPEDREKVGKPAEARLHLRAFHEGGQVNIEISDDGRGIDPERIRAKAIEKGVVTREVAARLSDREVHNLLFLPGFSTAQKVTNISGRGVGMDVVRSNIERIGGTVDIQSTKGLGTTLRIKIPLTLAIIPALIVKTGGDRFALPQVNLLELVRLEGEAARNGIEFVREAPVYRLRGRLLPLVYLNRTLGLADREPEADDEEPVVNMIILQADEQVFGLVVDEILDTEEIVVKPLGKQLKSLDVYAGATIMGDGAVALILDVIGLAHRAQVAASSRHIQARESGAASAASQLRTMLLFTAGDARRVAIPLSDVARLEEFPTSAIELAGSSEVMQYRGRILPLIRLSRVLGRTPPEDDETVQVVVYQSGNASVGLVVDEILDIVEDEFQVHRCNGRSGIVGSAVIESKVTDILDVQTAISMSGVDLFEDQASRVEA